MGQYYHPTLIGPRGSVNYLYSHDYNNGLKLMEHSYIGNEFVNAVLSQILNHPMKVSWIGDYSNDPWNGTEPYQHKMSQENFSSVFDKVYGGSKKHKIHPQPLNGFENITDFSGWYLVNHTQKVYINLKSYAERNKWREHWKDWRTGKEEDCDACVHPLPLLTACGNGRGGGDYYNHHPDYDQIGTWAFDLIEFTESKPEGYKEVSYHFTEQETVK